MANKKYQTVKSIVDNLMQIELNHISCEIASVELGFVEGQDISDFEPSKDLQVVMEDHPPYPMVHLLIHMLEHSNGHSMIPYDSNHDELSKGIDFNQFWDFSPPCVLIDTSGNMALCNKLGGRFLVKLNKISPQMRWGSYGNRFAASGTQKDIGPFASATITSSTTGELTEDGLHKYALKISLNTKSNLK